MKALLTSRAGVIVICVFAVVMAVVVQRVLARQAARKAPVSQVQSVAAQVPAGEPKVATNIKGGGEGIPASAVPASAPKETPAAADPNAQQDLAYLDQFQKSTAKSRVDKDRQGRTITRRRTASPVSRERTALAGDEAAAGSHLRLHGRSGASKSEEGPVAPSDVLPAARTDTGSPESPAAAASTPAFVPYGRPLKCELVFTVDSTLDESPVVALVVEPVFNNGVEVVPAGTELHGIVRPDRLRDRLFSGQDWVLVLPRLGGLRNGRELHVKGVALDRAEPRTDGLTWGITDGSLGLQGTVIRTMEFDELKRFAATFVSAAALGLQEREGVRGTSRVASTPRNAALQGLAVTLEEVARKIGEEVGRNGVFIRVPGGKQFYFYPQQAIVPDAATLPHIPVSRAAEPPGQPRKT